MFLICSNAEEKNSHILLGAIQLSDSIKSSTSCGVYHDYLINLFLYNFAILHKMSFIAPRDSVIIFGSENPIYRKTLFFDSN